MKSYVNLLGLSIMVSVLFGCASTGPTTFIADPARGDFYDIEEFPEWFQKDMAKEAEISVTTELVIEEFGITKTILGKAELHEQSENYRNYFVDIGAEELLDCYNIVNHIGAANSVESLVNTTLENLAANNPGLEMTHVIPYSLRVESFEETPYLSLIFFYTFNFEGDSYTDLIKVMAAETEMGLVSCIHSSMGYVETFKAAYESFLSAFLDAEKNDEFLEVTYVFRFMDMNVGYSYDKFTADADGDIKAISSSSIILPVSAEDFSYDDSTDITWSDSDGGVINSYSSVWENGKEQSNLSLN